MGSRSLRQLGVSSTDTKLVPFKGEVKKPMISCFFDVRIGKLRLGFDNTMTK